MTVLGLILMLGGRFCNRPVTPVSGRGPVLLQSWASDVNRVVRLGGNVDENIVSVRLNPRVGLWVPVRVAARALIEVVAVPVQMVLPLVLKVVVAVVLVTWVLAEIGIQVSDVVCETTFTRSCF